MRIGIFGGTFNPVHRAHLQMGRDALDACALDRVLFMPACDPPHKPLAGEVSFAHRLAMVEIALKDSPSFEPCDLEGRRGGKSYSVQTLQELQRLRPEDELYFIMGMDSFLEIDLWRDYRRLFELAHLVVLERPGSEMEDPLGRVPIAMAGEFCYGSAPDHVKILRHSAGKSVVFVSEHAMDISSTQIRNLLAEGRSARELLPDGVADYIERHALYTV